MPDLTDAEKELSSLGFDAMEIFRLKKHLDGKDIGYFTDLAAAVFDLGIEDDADIKKVMGTIIRGEATIETYQKFVACGFGSEQIMSIIQISQSGITAEQITKIASLATSPDTVARVSDTLRLLLKQGMSVDKALEKMADSAALLNQEEELQSTTPTPAEIEKDGKPVSAAVRKLAGGRVQE